MNKLNAGWSEIWDEGETGRMGEQVGGGDKGGVKVPVYTTAKRNTVSVENESRKGYRLCFDWRVDSQIQSEKPDSFFMV